MSSVEKSSSLQTKKSDEDCEQEREHKCLCIRRFCRTPIQILAAVVTVYISFLSSERYFQYWVQTSIERTDVHVSEIDFPAVTICPFKATVRNVTTGGEKQRLNRMYNMVQDTLWQTPEGAALTQTDFEEFPEYYDMSLSHIFGILRYRCEDIFVECMWRRRIVDCCSIFRLMGSEEGFCFAFNSLLSINPDPTWPWSVAGSGSSSGLKVKVNRRLNGLTVKTLGVIVYETNQYLGTSVVYSKEERIVIPIHPLRFTAEADVRSRPVEMRRCYFKNEWGRTGQSRSDCILKCHMEYITKMCHCYYRSAVVPQDYSQHEDNFTTNNERKTMRKCSFKDLPCFHKHRVSLFSLSNIIEESFDNVFSTTDCGCFPDCDHTQYHTSTYTERLGSERNGINHIELDIYFQEETLFSYRSTLRFTLLDLMVSFGGIAGLIMGISVLGGINAILNQFRCCKLIK